MPNNTEDTQAKDAIDPAKAAEGAADAQLPVVAGVRTVAVPRVDAPDDREVRRAKRAEAKAKKRADAAAKKASLAYAEVAAALRNLELAAQKVPATGASSPAAPALASGAAPAAATAAAVGGEAPATALTVEGAPEAPAAEPAPSAAPAAAAEAAPASAEAVASSAAPAAEGAVAPAAAVAAPAASAAVAPAVAAPAAAVAPVSAAPAADAAAAAPVAATATSAPVTAPPPPPAAPVAAPVPQPAGMAAAVPLGYPMPGQPYVVVEARRGHGRAIVLTLLGVVVAAALVAAGVFAYQQLVAPKPQPAQDVPTAVGPVANSAGIPMSKVSLRANAEGWSEEESTPVVAHIQRVGSASSSSSAAASPSATSQARATSGVAASAASYAPGAAPLRQAAEGSSSSNAAASSSSSSDAAAASGSAGYDAYHAFSANESTTLDLVPGRYTFTYLTPLNSDGSLYDVPEPMEVTVGDDGTALLPVNLTRVAADDVTKERAEQVIAALKAAMARGDGSFSNAAFKSAYDKAFSEWFAPKEDEEVDLTDEEKARLESQLASSSSASSSSAAAHEHTWTAVTENRVVNYTETVVESPAWQEPIYDARGNIIGYNYHPAITRNEEQQRTERVITGYRCSGCGAVVSAS